MSHETKFTPGPWRLGDITDGKNVERDIDATHHTGIAFVIWQMNCDREDGVRSIEQEANAHLIAAAPDLYEALFECERKLLRDEFSILSNMVLAALAKARGE